jgi:magnesium chelatase accessory protein
MIVGARDATIPPDQAQRVKDRIESATVETLAGLGHLSHEERPDLVATRIIVFARRLGIAI